MTFLTHSDSLWRDIRSDIDVPFTTISCKGCTTYFFLMFASSTAVKMCEKCYKRKHLKCFLYILQAIIALYLSVLDLIMNSIDNKNIIRSKTLKNRAIMACRMYKNHLNFSSCNIFHIFLLPCLLQTLGKKVVRPSKEIEINGTSMSDVISLQSESL